MQEHLRALIDRIWKLNQQYYSLRGVDDPETLAELQKLGGPAPQEEVALVEKYFRVNLPDDYRSFLMMHNGWEGFELGPDLLSTGQLLDPNLRRHFDELQRLGEQAEQRAKRFIIVGSANDSYMVFLDFSASGSAGRPEIVSWDYQEIDRRPSFTAYLESIVEEMSGLVEGEQRRLRWREV
jgi:SUKH superfamily protein